MWRLGRSDTFVRTARRLLRRDPKVVPRLAAALERLEADPHDPRLRLHRLHGPLAGLWSVRVTYRIRLILTVEEERHEIILLDIGTHDEVYD